MKVRKIKPVKSDEARASEASQFRTKILDLGFYPDDPDVKRMLQALDRFASEGVGQSGHIDSETYGYRFLFKLSTQPHIVSEMVVRKIS